MTDEIPQEWDDKIRDRVAWAMLASSGFQSPRAEWAENADRWRDGADAVLAAEERVREEWNATGYRDAIREQMAREVAEALREAANAPTLDGAEAGHLDAAADFIERAFLNGEGSDA